MVSSRVGFLISFTVSFRISFRVGFTVSFKIGFRVGFRVSFRLGYRVGFRVGFRRYINVSIYSGLMFWLVNVLYKYVSIYLLRPNVLARECAMYMCLYILT